MIRFFDVIFSLIAIIFLAPLFLIISIILKFTGEGIIFFFQERIGKGRKPFKLIKFVTMVKDSENIGTGTVTVKNDPRILPFGAFLRKTKINELPQLINILKGDMSIIGPRPQAIDCFNAFPRNMQDIIVIIKPGLSGIGPIIFRDEEEILTDQEDSIEFYNDVIGPYKAKVEAWYAENKSLYKYFLLILITCWVILFPKSNIVWKSLKNIPIPPDQLKSALNYRDLND